MSEEREFPRPPWATEREFGVVGHGIGRTAGGPAPGLNGPTPPSGMASSTSAPTASAGEEPEQAATADLNVGHPAAAGTVHGSWSSTGPTTPQASSGDGSKVASPAVNSGGSPDSPGSQTSEVGRATTQADIDDQQGSISSDLIGLNKEVDGFSEPAARCINKAAWIAYVLNHTSINTAHLVLAMCLDRRAALGMGDRDLDVAELRRLMIPLLIAAKWRYSSEADEKADGTAAVIGTTSDVSNILETARRKAGERDNQPATLPDLLDALKTLHAKGQLIPAPEETERVEVREDLQHVKAKLDELKGLVDQGFRWNVSRVDQAMEKATQDLLEALASPASNGDEAPEPVSSPAPEASVWRRPFRLALLGLL